jgi:hypothetical protein
MIQEGTYRVYIQLWTLDTDSGGRGLVDNFILPIKPRNIGRGATYVESIGIAVTNKPMVA